MSVPKNKRHIKKIKSVLKIIGLVEMLTFNSKKESYFQVANKNKNNGHNPYLKKKLLTSVLFL
jgi:hypothetical protein